MKKRLSHKKDRMTRILTDMRDKLDELDDLRADLEKEEGKTISSAQAKSLLEEIQVPELKMLRETKSKH
ncbi:MAG: hypothetical protein ABID38_05850 [Candidatus Diapherotrites archaeon]